METWLIWLLSFLLLVVFFFAVYVAASLSSLEKRLENESSVRKALYEQVTDVRVEFYEVVRALGLVREPLQPACWVKKDTQEGKT
jgi:hypothetical protein